MVRERVAKLCFLLALFLMPFARTVKLVDDPSISWIDPTLMLSVAAFFLVSWKIKVRPGIGLIALASVSAFLGVLLHRVDPSRPHAAWYIILRDPLALVTSLVWFWVCIRYFARLGALAARWLAASVITEMAISVYMYGAAFRLLPAPEGVQGYLRDYVARQVVIGTGALGVIPRMGGTYEEAPMFGLFMLSSLVVLVLALRQQSLHGRRDSLLVIGAIVAAVGTFASLSGQAALGAVVFLAAMSSTKLLRSKVLRRVAALASLVLVGFGIQQLYARMKYEQADSSGTVVGRTFVEREFHAEYAMKILGDEPMALFMGIGPGRYGDYAAETHLFPSSVVPGVIPVEWLVGYGVIGLIVICFWLRKIAQRAWQSFGRAGLAAFTALLLVIMFQNSWFWAPWFMALGFLYAARLSPHSTQSANARMALANNGVGEC
ncbi:MAG TPA: hypothetical protein VFW94_05025 [Candidatus Acidoferrales bacterium]|nr:hypothetical protein [Candidatus Acidoferrales bacterium]